MTAGKLRIQFLCGLVGVVLLSVLVASHGHSHDHHGHSHDHHGHDHHGHDHHGHDHHGHDHHGHDHDHHDHHAHEDHRHFYHASSYSEDEGADNSEPVDLKTEPKRKSNSLKPDEYFAKLKPSPGKAQEKMQMWLEAIGATVLISAAPFLILFLIPLDKDQPGQENFLRVLLAFASGGLLGDAFLHLIPHAVNPHSHGGDDHGHSHEDHGHSHDDHGHSHGDHGHDHSKDMMVGLWVLTGIIIFLAIEKMVRHIKGEGHSHGHGHSHGQSHSKEEDKKEEKDDKKGEVRKRKTSDKETEGDGKEDEGESQEDKAKGEKKEEAEKKENEEVVKEEDEIKVSAYLNLAADCTHNFTDGLAIGASFLVSRQLGIITTITILLHEVPHEIGDFAILVQSGCSKQKAMYLQLLTAVGALTGCICALLAEGAGDAATLWILPITAGGFIYIATVTVIPELLQKSSIKQSIVEIFALLAGVALMVLIAYAE